MQASALCFILELESSLREVFLWQTATVWEFYVNAISTSRSDSQFQTAEKTASRPFRAIKELVAIVALYTAIISVVFFPVVFQGKTTVFSAREPAVMPYGAYGNATKAIDPYLRCPDPAAPSWTAEPWMKLTQSLIYQEHTAPLWNAYSGCGAPYLANMQSQVLTPLNVILSAFASSLSYDVFVLARLVIGGVLAYLAARLWTPPACSAIAGLMFMLCGYHLLYSNLSEISVSMYLPAAFAATELVIRRRNILAVSLCAVSVGLVLLGGMPELAFVVLLFTSLFAAFRVFTISGTRERLTVLGILFCSYVAGIALAAPQILPFVEYMRLSLNTHDPGQLQTLIGLCYDSDWQRGLLVYLLPGVLKSTNHFPNFWGITATFLSLLALCAAVVRCFSKNSRVGAIDAVSIFLSVAAVSMIAKRFGEPIIQYFAALPIANMVIFTKYDEPLIGFSVALLSAIALKQLLAGEVGRRTIFFCAASLSTAIGYLLLTYRYLKHWPDLDAKNFVNTSSLFGAAVLLTLVALILFSRKLPRIRPYLPVAAGLFFLVEITFGYTSRAHYVDSAFGPRSADPFAGAPFVQFLQKSTAANHERIYGTNFLLMPEWSAAFKLFDSRTLDALYPARYLNFASNFFVLDESAAVVEFSERYYGSEPCIERELNQPLDRKTMFHRLCSLTSTRFVAITRSWPNQTNLLDPRAIGSKLNKYKFCTTMPIDGKTVDVLYQHAVPRASAHPVSLSCLVPAKHHYLNVGMIAHPDIPNGYRDGEGLKFTVLCNNVAGVGLRNLMQVHLKGEKGQIRPAPTYRRLDLGAYAGKRVTLTLTVATASKDPGSGGWGAWTPITWSDATGGAPASDIAPGEETVVYDGADAKVIRIGTVVPRAAVYTHVDVVSKGEDAKALLANSQFDPMQSAVLEKDDLTSVPAILNTTQPLPCTSATITNYASDKIRITCEPNREALLVLNDTYYPGWTAKVDGKPVQILKANYCFRGVLLQAGKHTVDFNYDPLSFRLGVWLAAIAASILAIVGLFRARKKPE